MRSRLTYGFVLLLALLIVFDGCKKDVETIYPDAPTNPYDGVDYGDDGNEVPVDSNSFLGLHKFIFSTTCAVPACHDGSFEPDFRTVQSTYNTLVYHDVINNNAAMDFEYRVVPGDTQASWLHERITTTDEILGRMPLYDTLFPEEVRRIENWILDGAKDVFGNSPVLPNLQPTFFGVLAYENDTMGMRLDTIRADFASPMVFPENTQVELWFGIYDTDLEGSFIPGGGLGYNKIRISQHILDFSDTDEMDLNVESALTPFFGPLPFGGGQAPYYHSFVINTADYNTGQINYMRVYVQDDHHSFPTELPDGGSQLFLMTYFAFIVSP